MSAHVDHLMARPFHLVVPASGPAHCPAISSSSGLDGYRTISPAVRAQLRAALPMIPLVRRLHEHGDQLAVIDGSQRVTYDQLLADSTNGATALLAGTRDLQSQCVATVIPSSYEWVFAQLAVWRAGGIAVPLAAKDPPAKLAAFLDDARTTILIVTPELRPAFEDIAAARGIRLLTTAELGTTKAGSPLPVVAPERPAMILYTSGTTGGPKGVLTTHRAFTEQLTALISAWQWSADDRIANFLPLNHLHGILAVVCSALWSGASVEMLRKFDPMVVWQRIRERQITLLMGVPSIYHLMNTAWRTRAAEDRAAMTAGARDLRLAISGSGRLPPTVRAEWERITGKPLHQRWGQTELGLPIIQPINKPFDLAAVGRPVDTMDIRVVDEQDRDVPDGTEGELLVRGPMLFTGYWRRPETTLNAFRDGWYCTGDVVIQRDNAVYFVRRKSGQSIKTNSEFVSAPAVEDQILLHPAIRDCVVVGVPDDRSGQVVCAAVIVHPDHTFNVGEMRAWLSTRLSAHEIPFRWKVVSDFPRSHAGKPIIPEIERLFVAA